MINNPRVSVILPVYKVEKYIRSAIDSVLKQSYRNIEIILVDDESPDNCPEICDEYSRKDERIKVIHKQNGGLAEARNSGLNLALGDFIYFLDSDDWIAPDALESLVNVVTRYPDVDFVFSKFVNVHIGENIPKDDSSRNVEVFEPVTIQELFLCRKRVVLAPGTLYSMKWYKDNHMRFLNIPYSEDQIFLWQGLLKVRKVAFLDRILYYYLVRPGSIMTSSSFLKIQQAYPFYIELQSTAEKSDKASPLVKRFLLSRWTNGIFHSAAKLCNFDEYKSVLCTFEAGKHCRNLLSFPDYRIKICSSIYFLSKYLYYKLNRFI